MSSRAQVQKALGIFLAAHDQRCPDPHLTIINQLFSPDFDIVRMRCRTCDAGVTRIREGEDWSATWHFREHDVIEHPQGCTDEHQPHSHDEHGDVQLQLVK